MYDELGLDPQTDMAEASHLNYRGTGKLSRYLAEWLASNYDLADHRGDETYASWEENAADWKQKYANQMLTEEEGWYDFLQLLSENEGTYTYVIGLTGAYDNGEQPIGEVLSELGVPEEVLEQGGVFIGGLDGGTVLPGGADGSYVLEFAASDLEVKVSGGNQSVVYSGESELKTLNGINVLVYDHFTESLVTAVGFDAENGYTCVH